MTEPKKVVFKDSTKIAVESVKPPLPPPRIQRSGSISGLTSLAKSVIQHEDLFEMMRVQFLEQQEIIVKQQEQLAQQQTFIDELTNALSDVING